MVSKDSYTILNHFLTENHENGSNSTKIDADLCGSIPGSKKINYDSKNMKITNRPDIDAYIKEPVREGWEYGGSIS